MQKERVPRVDKNDKLIEVVDRIDAYNNGWIHRCVQAIVLNTKGEYLVSQRSVDKLSWPNHHDLGLAETVGPYESYIDALKRGLKEELGLDDYSKCELIRAQYYQEYFWKQYKIFGILYLYMIVIDAEPTFDDGEVQESQWMSKEEVSLFVSEKPKECTPWFIANWSYYLAASI